MTKLLAPLILLLATQPAWAFGLPELTRQLSAPAVVRGEFVQEKHLRALPNPLVSRGSFVLTRDRGLLWFLDKPFAQRYRITAAGIAQYTPAGWQPTGQQDAGRQNRLFLAVLSGDTEALAEDFELALSGDAADWQLQMTPRSRLLAEIFEGIRIEGGATVERIELNETQGDRTLLRLEDSQPGERLSDDERHAFAD
ncbi:outer membrane lipoprotein carrier protein LolA [Stutzerimonas azotifigens]|uniref:outer membrane lipoprotein carrier protein LolA n=1 Tax=Stutzerimonas azotifigens TaxID=291995 RepID=UPI000486FB0A